MAKPTRYTEAMAEEYVAKGWWDSTTLADIYDRNAQSFPDKEAFLDSQRRVTWAKLKRMSDRIALGLLELGFQKDQVLISHLPNRIEDVALRIGLEKAGVIHLTAPMTLGEAELDHFLRRTGAVAACTVGEYHGSDRCEPFQRLRARHPHLRHIIVAGDRVPEGAISLEAITQAPLEERYPPGYLARTKFGAFEVSHLKGTTGTTGLPKLCEVVISADRLQGRHTILKLKITARDVGLLLLPLWAGASMPIIDSLPLVGAKVVVMETFDAGEALETIEREGVTFVLGFPVHVVRMMRHPRFGHYNLSSLRVVQTVGAFLTAAAEELERSFGAPWVNGYGAVDARANFSPFLRDPPEIRHRTVGTVAPWDEVKILDENKRELPPGEVGEIHWRGASGSGGYYRDQEATLAGWGALGPQGWYNLRDLGRLDEAGNLILVGRREDIIRRGGQSIYPVEVESLLGAWPKIQDVCVVAMPDPELGERACAFVVPREGEEIAFPEIVAFLAERRIAKYKLPERLEIRRELPLVGPGKVNRKALEQEVAQILRAEGGAP